MSKLLATVSLFVLLGLPAAARADSSLFAKGGVDAAKFNQDYRTNKYGLFAGIGGHVDRTLSEHLLLGGQLELSYVQRGSKAVVNDILQSNTRLHYLDIAINARPAIRFGMIGAYLLLGAGLGVALRATDVNASGMSQDIIDNMNRIDISLTLGAGVAFHPFTVKPGSFMLDSLFLEIRHEHGLLDIDTADLGVRNRNSALLFGVSFVLPSEQ